MKHTKFRDDKMKAKREYIINELMKAQFVEHETERVHLEETEDTGKSVLELQLSSGENLSIKNVDKKNTQIHFFVNDKSKSMNKRVDHIVFQCLGGNDWKVHLIEMKSSVGNNKWPDVKGKFRASYLLVQGIAAMLEMNLVETCMYTSFEETRFEPSGTMPIERRLPVGGRHVRPQEEWSGEKFALNFGDRISFVHTPVQMRRNDRNILVGKLSV